MKYPRGPLSPDEQTTMDILNFLGVCLVVLLVAYAPIALVAVWCDWMLALRLALTDFVLTAVVLFFMKCVIDETRGK